VPFKLLLVALSCSQVLGAATTVRPYKFGFTIDEQMHRQEKRDDRGIVMGEFGFITADGIYHVTVYATDEEGKFRIISMKSYPYNGPIGSKSVPAVTTARAPPAAAEAPAPPRHNFNTEACSGCFLKKTPVKTEIRTLSQPLAPGKTADQGLNVQLPFRDSIAQTVATQLGLGQVTQHSTHTYTNPSAKIPPRDIEVGLKLAMSTFYDSRAAVTGHVSTQNQKSGAPSSTKVDYNVGVTRKAGPVTYSSLNTRLSEDAIRSASTYSGQVTAPLPLGQQPLVVPSSGQPASLSSSSRPGVNIGNALRGGVASAKQVSGLKTPHTTLAHTPLLNSATSTAISGVAAHTPTGSTPSYNNGGAGAGAGASGVTGGKSPAGNAAGKPQFGSAGKGGVSGGAGAAGGFGASGGAGGLGASVAAGGLGASGGAGGFGPSGGAGGLGASGGAGGLGAAGGAGGFGKSGGSGGSGKSGSGFGPSGGFGGASGTGTISRGDTGDLYKFKYVLDYNGHEETGSRNGDKQGSYFAIGEDAVERTIEYVANEFGFQPHVSWKRLDGKAALPEENSLKHYEFKWFN
ncbi:hypothetical protein KR054_002961, partial [Drosophila jambulina]